MRGNLSVLLRQAFCPAWRKIIAHGASRGARAGTSDSPLVRGVRTGRAHISGMRVPGPYAPIRGLFRATPRPTAYAVGYSLTLLRSLSSDSGNVTSRSRTPAIRAAQPRPETPPASPGTGVVAGREDHFRTPPGRQTRLSRLRDLIWRSNRLPIRMGSAQAREGRANPIQDCGRWRPRSARCRSRLGCGFGAPLKAGQIPQVARYCPPHTVSAR
jgi:hypothetical protein